MTSQFTYKHAWAQLSLTDKILPLAIISAMALGILLSVYVPSSRSAFDGVTVVGVSLPLAVGLIVMMVPPLCKVQWESFHRFFSLKTYLRPVVVSVVLNWLVCPLLMFALSWATLFDHAEYRVGIIMIGLARCIAMVLVWNEIADGDRDLCAVIVIVNSVLQLVLYAPYQILFCYVISGDTSRAAKSGVAYSLVAKSVLFFLGVPLVVGLVVRLGALSTIGAAKYQKSVVPYISPWAFIGLIYTIVVIFIERGNLFIREIGSGLRCFVPLVLYFLLAWFGTFFAMRYMDGGPRKQKKQNKETEIGDDVFSSERSALLCGCEKNIGQSDLTLRWTWRCGASYAETITQTFTAASNNFELSLAIAISLYGSGSQELIAATFGPLLEVPILLLLCFVAQYFKLRFLWRDVNSQGRVKHTREEHCETLEI